MRRSRWAAHDKEGNSDHLASSSKAGLNFFRILAAITSIFSSSVISRQGRRQPACSHHADASRNGRKREVAAQIEECLRARRKRKPHLHAERKMEARQGQYRRLERAQVRRNLAAGLGDGTKRGARSSGSSRARRYAVTGAAGR